MKITPMSGAGAAPPISPAGEPQLSTAQRVKALRMKTQATPMREPPAAPTPPPAAAAEPTPPANQELTIPGENKPQDDAAHEATKPLSPQLAALAREKRALQVKERAIADRERALAEREASQGQGLTKAQIKANPLGVLLDAGVTYEELTAAVVADRNGDSPKVRELEQQLASMRQDFDKKLTDRETQAEEAALAEMEREAQSLVSQGEDFELVRSLNKVPEVMQLIRQMYKEKNIVLHVREACQLVEDELLVDAERWASLNKVKAKFAPPSPPVAAPQQRPMTSLSNRDSASPTLDRRARAMAKFLNQQ